MKTFVIFYRDKIAEIIADEWSINNNLLFFYKNEDKEIKRKLIAVFSMFTIAGFKEKSEEGADE